MFRSAAGKAIRVRRATAEGAALLVAAAMAAAMAASVVALWHASPAQAQGTANPPITVTSAADDGEGSLRAAINAANGAAGEDKIVFELGQSATIPLASQLPTVTDAAGLTIDGGGADITVSGNFRVRVFVVGSGATLTLNKLAVANGLAVSAESGGGIVNNGGTLEVSNSTISGNIARDAGGSIYNLGTLTVRSSTISESSASRGGGIFNGGTATVSNSTISGNSAGLGGGINNEGTLTVASSTFSGNHAGIVGGGIYNRAGNNATLENTIVANSSGEDCYAESAEITDGGHNFSEDATCGFTAASGSLSGVDPLLGPLQDNGGPTETHALQQGSPAIDAGPPPSECPPPAADQRGVQRPQGDGCDIGAFELEVPNRAPVAKEDSASTEEDTPLDVDVLSNDSDPDPLDAPAVQGLTQPRNGAANANPDGTVRYTPDKDFNGTDSFSYTVSDGRGGQDEATVRVEVGPVNDGPTTRADSYAAREDGTLRVSAPGVLSNDKDSDGDTLGVLKISGTKHGTLALGRDGSFSYTPDKNYSGPDSFSYRATDGEVRSETARVSIAVREVNDAPLARDDSYAAVEGRTLTAEAPGVLANDSDPEGDKLSASLASGPRHGRLTLKPDGSFVYAPDKGYSGSDSFSYRASDGEARSQAATVKIAVRASSEGDPRGCTIVGTPGKDTIEGTPKADVVCALGGNDVVSGLGGDDRIYGDAGIDAMAGGAGDDRLYGGRGADALNVRDASGGDVADGDGGTDVCLADRGDTKRSCP